MCCNLARTLVLALLCIGLVSSWLTGADADHAKRRTAADQRILLAIASDPACGSYKYLALHFRDDAVIDSAIGPISTEALPGFLAAREFGFLQLAVGRLYAEGEITPGEIRRWSVQTVKRQDQGAVFHGRAKTALAWLLDEDDWAVSASDLIELGDGLNHPLLALNVGKKINAERFLILLDDPRFIEVPLDTRSAILDFAITQKFIPREDERVQKMLWALVDAPVGKRMSLFFGAADRGERLHAEFARALRTCGRPGKDRNQQMIIQLAMVGRDLLAETDVIGLALDPEAERILMRARSGQPMFDKPKKTSPPAK